jgi:Cu(I)/Ag(I) efflux system membrane protein CusA/SilA
MREVPGTASAFAERTVGGNYLEIRVKRDEAGRYGISVENVRSAIRIALGGMPVTTTVEGLERYSVNVRLPREMRDSPKKSEKS